MNIREKQLLEQDIPIFEREIRTLYKKFDKEYGLNGAKVQMKFTFDEKVLGAYTPPIHGQKEYFMFSLFFIGYCNKDSMHYMDKIDLFAHEYAHYMQYNYEIPKEYLFQPGKHGSAWKYCCSLVGAAPTEYYRIGEGLLKHDYNKVLYNPKSDKLYTLKDQRRQQQIYRNKEDSVVHYEIGQTITHPKFGTGIIRDLQQTEDSVRLKIAFGNEIKLIDQKWLLRTQYKIRN